MHAILVIIVALRYTLHVKSTSLSELWGLLPCSKSSMHEYGHCIFRTVHAQVQYLLAEDTAPPLTKMLFVSPHSVHAWVLMLGGM